MNNKIVSFILVVLISISFSACENPFENKPKENINKYKASLSIPKWDKEAKKNIDNYWSNWSDAKHDPIAATKIGFAYSEQLKDYEKALQWFKYSNSMKATPNNSNYACYALQQLKKYDKAIPWCQDAIKLGSDEAIFQLATTYFKLNNYDNSLQWFKKAYVKGNKNASNNIGLNYVKLKNYNEAQQWYKTAIKEGSLDAYVNMSNLYLDFLNDGIKGAAYAIALINTKYTKASVLNVLKNEEMLSNETIKKGYELQLNSAEFPIHYDGKLDLE